MIVPDYDARLAALRSKMAAAGASIFICDHGEMLAWLTGYSVSETLYRACLVPIAGEPVWVLRTIDEAACRAKTWITDVRTFRDDEDPYALIASVVLESSENCADGVPNRIAADFRSYGFTADTQARLLALLKIDAFIDLNGISDQIRAIKDPFEIGCLERAATIADDTMALLRDRVSPGMKVRKAAAIAAYHYLDNGADDWWVGPMTISRRRSKAETVGADLGFLHPPGLDDQVLQEGDILHAELVPRVNGYSARIMRSISIGSPDDETKITHDELVRIQDAQLNAMATGVDAKMVDKVARSALSKGLRSDFPNVTGYQIGLYTKTPRSSDFSFCFHPNADWCLRDGMTFHMYLSAKGLAISESIVMEHGRARRLCQTPRRLLIAGSTKEPD